MKNVTIMVFIMFIIFAGIICLQMYLSKKKNKWFGLILPAICLLYSLSAVLSIPMYTSKELTVRQIDSNGTVVEERSVEPYRQTAADADTSILQMVSTFLLSNIPTAILLIIYFACRDNIKKNRQLEKMQIQDLE